MRKLLVFGAGILAAWFGGEGLAVWLHPRIGAEWEIALWGARFLAFFGGLILAEILFSLRSESGGGVSAGGMATVLRPVTGMIAGFAIQASVVAGFLFILASLINAFLPIPNDTVREQVIVASVLAAALVHWLCFGWNGERDWLYRLIGRATSPLRRLLRVIRFGKGGSAAFAGLLTEWASLWRPGSILLGRSAYGRKWPIGLTDDRHLLTIASTGGGKGRSAIIPNLLTWPGSALVIDPKGTNAAVTAARRSNGGGRIAQGLGQTVHVFDPFGVLAGQGIESAVFNPLAQLDPASDRIAEDIWAIADALVVTEPGGEHWDESAHSVISGLIAHVITQAPPEKRHLGHVRDLLTSAEFTSAPEDSDIPDLSVLGRMALNPGAAGLAARAAAQLQAAGDGERGSIISTAMRHTKWLDSVPMRAVLSGAGFDLRDLKRKAMTVYVVIPPEELENHKRFLRLFVTLGLAAMTRETTRPKHRVLFVIDEFPALGRMESVRVGINVIRSYGVILWPIIQNISQLVHLYGRDAQSFLDATGAVQVFSIGGQETAAFIADNLGERLVDRKARGQVITALTRLRTAGEIREQTDRDWSAQIILRAGKTPLLLKRVMYDRDFRSDEFSSDPDHPEKRWIDKIRWRRKPSPDRIEQMRSSRK
jgi:type IV secretory pathway TraG/TraD family ATPase VirD4